MAPEPPTVREGRRPPDGPHEGVPAHLNEPLVNWLETAFKSGPGRNGDAVTMLAVATACRIPLFSGARHGQIFGEIAGWSHGEPDRLLDVIHAAIQVVPDAPVGPLDRMLVYGGSVWTATPTGLQRRVDPTAQAAFHAACRPADAASEELVEAWSNAYGRHPNASDAWDHAIKAVELVLIPIVVPNQRQSQIGHVIGQLDKQGQLWEFVLPGPNDDHNIGQFVGMLRLLWPNPDRHGDPQQRRMPTLEEARAVVQLAVTIVQWARDGLITRR